MVVLYDPKSESGGAAATDEKPKLPAGVTIGKDGWPEGDYVIPDAACKRVAEHFVNWCHTHRGHHTLVRYAGEWHATRGDVCGYQPETDEAVQAGAMNHLDGCWRPVVDARTGKPTGEVKPFRPRVSQVREAVEAAKSVVSQVKGDMPRWIGSNQPFADPNATVTFRNGILDVEQFVATGKAKLIPPSPYWFTAAACPFDFDELANEPAEWLRFLDTLKLKPDEVLLLREFMGYCLTADTSQQKALMLVGPRRSGKGTILRILGQLVGLANVASPTLGSLGTNFGLSPLLGKLIAIISDARLSGRTDQAVVTERLLSITGEDVQTVDVKHRDPVTVTLRTRFVIATNELPRLADSSGALSGRLLILPFTQSFYGSEDTDLGERLNAELPGILLWALEGLRTLRRRGHFIQPQRGGELQQQMDDLASPVGAFVRDRCSIGQGLEVACGELWRSWCDWCDEQGRKSGNQATFGRDLRAAVPGVGMTNRRTDFGRCRFYEGITTEAA